MKKTMKTQLRIPSPPLCARALTFSTSKIHQHTLKADFLPDKLRLQRHIPSASKREDTDNEAGLRRGAVSCDPMLEDQGGAGRWSRVKRERERESVESERERECVQRAQLPGARGSLAQSRKMQILDLRDSGATVFTGLPHILPQDPVNASIPQGLWLCSCVCVCMFFCVCMCLCMCVIVRHYVCARVRARAREQELRARAMPALEVRTVRACVHTRA